MNFFHAIILGIVEGITEFLPISSTGHLILTSKILNLSSTEFLKSFEIAIQLASILSVVYLYWKTVLNSRKLIAKVIAAFIPTALVGALLYRQVKDLLDNNQTVLWSLFLGGIFLIGFEWWQKNRQPKVTHLDQITYKQAVAIGLFQSVGLIPGVSRAGATILGGLTLGLSRKTIVEFSFLLAIPTMAAATGYDLIKTGSAFSIEQFEILAAGFVVAFIVAVFAIKFLLKYAEKSDFTAFGIYRIIVALLFWLFWV